MLKYLLTAGLTVVLLGLVASDVQAAGRRRNCSPSYAVVTAPAQTAQAAPAGTGYRTYSYEPSAVVTPSIAPMRRASRVPPYLEAGRHSAGYKLTDF